MSENAPLWVIAVALYTMLLVLLIALWQVDFTVGRLMAMVACFYVGAGFGILAGYILAHILRRGML